MMVVGKERGWEGGREVIYMDKGKEKWGRRYEMKGGGAEIWNVC